MNLHFVIGKQNRSSLFEIWCRNIYLSIHLTAARTDMSWNYMKFVFTFSILSGILMERKFHFLSFRKICLIGHANLAGLSMHAKC